MATSKTSSFWLTEELALSTAGQVYQGTLDLGAYVDVGDQQAIAIEQVDFITQGYDTADNHYNNSLIGTTATNASLGFQLSDLNPATNFLAASDIPITSRAVRLTSTRTVLGRWMNHGSW